MTASAPASPGVERISRWEGAGGTWEVVARGPGGVTVSLRRCDGGEEADRFTSADDGLLAYLAGRTRSDE